MSDITRALERVKALDRIVQSEVRRLDGQHEAQIHAVQLVRNADALAQAKLEATLANRFETVNEFRNALADLSATMATRRELEAYQAEVRIGHANLIAAISDLRTSIAVGPADLHVLQNAAAESTGERRGIDRSANLLSRTILTASGLLGIVVIVATFLATH